MHAAEKKFSEALKPRALIELVSQNNGPAVHVIKTYDANERPCWFLLKAHERSLAKLAHTAYEDIIDLKQFGEVVASGWGHEPDVQALKLHQ